MPAYEPKREHIRAAVESVLAQTFADWTLLINDDASQRENTEAHIADFLTDPRISFSRNERNLGIGGNWNATWKAHTVMADSSPSPGGRAVRGGRGGRGVRESGMGAIAFLFHDDLWEPAYLERMLAALDAHPSAGFACADHAYLREGDVRTFPLYDELRAFKQENVTPGLHDHRTFLRWWMDRGLHPNVIGEPSFVVLRRSLMEEVGPFDEEMKQFLDIEYWTRCLLRSDFVYVAQSLGSFRVHPEGTSALNEAAGRGVFERLITLERIANALPRNQKRRAHRAIVRALAGMIDKYRNRRKRGGTISLQGSGGLRQFILRHPVLLLRAGLRWIVIRP